MGSCRRRHVAAALRAPQLSTNPTVPLSMQAQHCTPQQMLPAGARRGGGRGGSEAPGRCAPLRAARADASEAGWEGRWRQPSCEALPQVSKANPLFIQRVARGTHPWWRVQVNGPSA
jgi:hypothetical protein